MHKKEKQKAQRNNIVNKFFEEFGVRPTHRAVEMFRDYLDDVLKINNGSTQVEDFQIIIENWLKDKYQPDMFTTGGTINTLLSEKGSRIPDKGVQEKLLDESGKSTRKKVIVYDYAFDSSNQNLMTQERLMNQLGKVAFEDIEKLENIELHLKKPGKYLGIDQIPYYFSFPKPSGPGTVITHGTDTLEENAALSAYMMLRKTLVWTGSWASPEEKGSDAIDNIEKAKILANNSLTPIGVYVVIGNEIHLASRLKKINTHPWEAKEDNPYLNKKPWRKKEDKISYFASLGDNPVGYFGKYDEIFFNTKFLKVWERILTKRFDNYFPLGMVKNIKPAYVEHIIIDKYTPKEVFEKLIKRLLSKNNRCGAIIEGEITQNPYYLDFISEIKEIDRTKGIFILSTSKTKLSEAYSNLNYISASQLRIKLSALLGRDDVYNNSAIMLIDDNLTGEVSEKEVVDHSYLNIPKEFYKRGEFVIAFPGMTKDIFVDAIQSLKDKIVPADKERVLLINGYGDGHIPIGCLNMQERIIVGLKDNQELLNQLLDSINNNVNKDKPELDYSINNVLKHLKSLLDNNSDKAKHILQFICRKKSFTNKKKCAVNVY